MVVMALVTTFMTTPAVMYLYPEWYQKQTLAIDNGNKIDVDERGSADKLSTVAAIGLDRYCIVTMLNRIESVPSMMALLKLLKREKIPTKVEIHALRLLELTQRTSAVMKYKDSRETKRQDPVLNVLRTFANLIGIQSLQTHLDYCPSTDYIKTISDYSAQVDADLILLPWVDRFVSSTVESSSFLDNATTFDLDFAHQAFSTIQHCTTGMFIDRGFGQIQDGDNELIPQIIVLFRENCLDDQAALLFALRLQAYRKIDLMILRKGNTSDHTAITYANNQTIQDYIHHRDINRLFIEQKESSISSNVVCKYVSSFDDATVSKSVPRPLDKHDLIILGKKSEVTVTDEELVYENALGQLGYHILKSGTKNTSVLIIQSPTI